MYYLDEEDKLCRIKTDGSGRQKLGDDKCIETDVAGDWIYYSVRSSKSGNPNDPDTLYRIKTDGSGRELVY